jgi:hypothetical protein
VEVLAAQPTIQSLHLYLEDREAEEAILVESLKPELLEHLVKVMLEVKVVVIQVIILVVVAAELLQLANPFQTQVPVVTEELDLLGMME